MSEDGVQNGISPYLQPPLILKSKPDEPLAEPLSEALGWPICDVDYVTFKGPGDPIPGTNKTFGGERKLVIKTNLRNRDVFIPFSVWNTDYDLKGLYMAIRTAKKSGKARHVTVIPFYMSYSRQERTNERREPLSLSDEAIYLKAAGCNSLFIFELHERSSEGAFTSAELDVELISPRPILAHCLPRLYREVAPAIGLNEDYTDMTIASPDQNAEKKTKSIRSEVQEDIEMLRNLPPHSFRVGRLFHDKDRDLDVPNQTSTGGIYGEVRQFTVFIDDELRTGGTLFGASDATKALAARQNPSIPVYTVGYCTHAFGDDEIDEEGNFVKSFFDRFLESSLDMLVVSNTLPFFQRRLEHYFQTQDREKAEDLARRVRIIDIVPLFAEVLRRSLTGATIRDMMKEVRKEDLYTLIRGEELFKTSRHEA